MKCVVPQRRCVFGSRVCKQIRKTKKVATSSLVAKLSREAKSSHRNHGIKIGSKSKIPLVDKKIWKWLPDWVALHAERGRGQKCWFGHRLYKEDFSRSKHPDVCTWCTETPGKSDPIMNCRQCHWLICSKCKGRPRLPALQNDPLFMGPHSPCLLPSKISTSGRRGTIIVCPGGNYEFLNCSEGVPVADMYAKHDFRVFVLRYRLLPRYGLDASLADLAAAIKHVRHHYEGPVAAVGFSAGGHLVACHAIRQSEKKNACEVNLDLDAQVLVYPCIDGKDWADTEECHFSNFDQSWPNPKAQSMIYGREALLGGAGFTARPTFMVASTKDESAPPEEHTDLYAKALRSHRVPLTYLRRDFGGHGFGVHGGWFEECLKWLQSSGFN